MLTSFQPARSGQTNSDVTYPCSRPDRRPRRRRRNDQLQAVVDEAQDRFGNHELFPKGRLTNYVRYTKTDMEARCEIERIPRSSPQRTTRWRRP